MPKLAGSQCNVLSSPIQQPALSCSSLMIFCSATNEHGVRTSITDGSKLVEQWLTGQLRLGPGVSQLITSCLGMRQFCLGFQNS